MHRRTPWGSWWSANIFSHPATARFVLFFPLSSPLLLLLFLFKHCRRHCFIFVGERYIKTVCCVLKGCRWPHRHRHVRVASVRAQSVVIRWQRCATCLRNDGEQRHAWDLKNNLDTHHTSSNLSETQEMTEICLRNIEGWLIPTSEHVDQRETEKSISLKEDKKIDYHEIRDKRNNRKTGEKQTNILRWNQKGDSHDIRRLWENISIKENHTE